MIVVIDNFDSFTYNLVQYIGEIESEIKVIRNNALSADEVLQLQPSHIVISPGPCTPKEAGISIELIQKVPSNIPLFGVCLGHQAIGEAFGGRVIRAPYLMHGKTSSIYCRSVGIYKDMPEKFLATRYHSLIVERESLPPELEITAETQDGLIMGLQHKKRPIVGVQFHPESILTHYGKDLMKNFLAMKGTA